MKKYILFAIILQIVMYCSLNTVHGQSTSATNSVITSNTPASTLPLDYLGWANSVYYPLNIATLATGTSHAQRINFFTDSVFRMVIDSITGFVGIGKYFNSPTAPAYLLDVDSGDINIGHDARTDSFGYRIGHNYVLWNNGNVRNIYVGVNAGKANAAASAVNNTFCG